MRVVSGKYVFSREASPPYIEYLCQVCPANSTSVEGCSGISQCVCVLGFVHTQNMCNMCTTGGFCVDEMTYTACPVHKNSLAGASSVLECPCVPGYYGLAGAQDYECCPVNYYCAGGQSIQACPANSTTLTRARQTNITACRGTPGFYKASDGACVECPINSRLHLHCWLAEH